jgi:hypothetical protein
MAPRDRPAGYAAGPRQPRFVGRRQAKSVRRRTNSTLLEPDREKAATYLYNSLITGPAEPNLLKARLSQIQNLHNELFRRDADLVEQELRLTAGAGSAY